VKSIEMVGSCSWGGGAGSSGGAEDGGAMSDVDVEVGVVGSTGAAEAVTVGRVTYGGSREMEDAGGK
jgi:hypothetical protein